MTWVTGQKLQNGKYIIQQVLKQGGFGITYQALQVNLKRSVVIKTPNEYLQHDPDYDKYIKKFIAEGKILAELSKDPHSHIVIVIELFQEGNTHCLVMEFIPGENLFQAVKRRGALPEAEIVTYIRQIGEALIVVHEAGLVHRDAHPGNIMLRSNGKAVLIDFGISKEIVPLTGTQMSKDANAAFAPYEQITRGTSKPTVDIYSLAATLYYGVTGQKPSVSLARKVDNQPLIPPQRFISGISNKLNQAILKGMALEAKNRPLSMQAWLKMLDHKVKPSLTNQFILYISAALREIKIIPLIRNAILLFKKSNWNKLIRAIPWGWLISSLIFHAFMGYLLTTSHAPFWGVAVAVIGAVVMARSVVAAGSWWSAAIAGSVTLAVSVAIGGAGSWWLAVAMAGACGNELEKSFNKFHTFLILAGISNLGLGLGWLGHRLFNPVS